MDKNFDILIFKIGKRLIGIDCKEVIKTINNISTDEYMSEKKIKKIHPEKIFRQKTETEYNSAILVENKQEEKYCFFISSIEEIKFFNLSDIYIIPDYLKNKQDPFFVWGFLEADDLVTLITFDYFK